MPDDDEKPDALDDVKKGLGLLFRAAKTAVRKLPTEPIEKVVIDGAKEVGRAVENVASSLEKEVFGDRPKKTAADDAKPSEKSDAKSDAASSSSPPVPPDDVPKGGPRV